MTPETIKSVQEALTPLAEKLGEGAAHVYEVYTRQIYAESVGMLVIAGMLSAVLVAWLIFISRPSSSDPSKTRAFAWSDASDGFSTVFTSCLSIIILPGVIALVFNGLIGLINPEYYAIQRLLETITK